MMSYRIILITLFSMFFYPAHLSAQGFMDTVLNRFSASVLEKVETTDVGRYVSTLNDNGQWDDIDYKNRDQSTWQTAKHLNRVRSLAIAWSLAGSAWYQNIDVWNCLIRALDHWTEARYQNPNWWHNEIGVPQLMLPIITLTRARLTSTELNAALAVLKQYREINGVGANLTWSADLAMHYGALTGDSALVRRSSDLIANEIVITSADGIQSDYSFHQHGARLQSFHYGSDFFTTNLRIGWELRETPWAFPVAKVKIITDFFLKGWQLMSRAGYTVPSTKDRAVSRAEALRIPSLQSIISCLQTLNGASSAALAEVDRLDRSGQRTPGFYYFPSSDFSVYHHPEFSFFLKTISSRTLSTEAINRENKKGQLLNCGDAYLVRDGLEYYDLMPVWNWNYPPGTTGFNALARPERKQFAGSVSDGSTGATALDIELKKDSINMVTSKFWAVWNNLVICLIADLNVQPVQTPLFTVLDQCRWRGEVTLKHSTKVVDQPGIYKIGSNDWIHHSGFAYIPLYGGAVTLTLKDTAGSWKSINEGESNKQVHDKVFQPMMQHGGTGREKAAYVIAFCPLAEQVPQLIKKQEWNIISNTRACQAVQFSNGTLMVAFREQGMLKTNSGKVLRVNRPCMLQLSDNLLFVSDPLHVGGVLQVSYENKIFSIEMQADGSTKLPAINLK